MTETVCGYGATRDEVLVAYLYGDIAADARVEFIRHLNGCAACRRELEALGAVRTELQRWAPPDADMTFVADRRSPGARPPVARPPVTRGPVSGPRLSVPPVGTPAVASRSGWREIPIWAQVAVALVFIGIAANIANLDVTYNREGLAVRTGRAVNAGPTPSAAVTTGAMPDTPSSPVATQAELAALGEQLRAELRASAGAARADAVPARAREEEIVRRVRALIRDSEQRQQRELALRIAEVAQDAQAQRQADLVRIDRTLGALQSTTGSAVRRQEQLLNNLAVRVSQRR
jgi:Putative zinc-finger